MKEVFLDALLDSLKILPFLIIVYIIIEVIESHSKFKKNKLLQSRIAPLFGAGVGLVPQCGFSVMATNLYAHRNISLGTLVAVYIATSDEAIPILLSNYDKIGMLLPLILIKFAMALVAGFALDLVMRRPKQKALPLQKSQTKACNLGENGEAEAPTKACNFGKNGEAEAPTAANSEAETRDAEKLFETPQNADTQQASKIERVEEPASLAEKSICAVTSKTEVTEAKDTASTVQDVDKKISCKAESAQNSTTFDKNIGHNHAEADEDGGGHDHAEADEDGGGHNHAEADEDGGGHNHAEHEADEPQKGCCGHSLSKVQVYLVHPLVHSLKIFVYILLVNLAMGIAIFYLGQEKLQAIMLSSHAFQPFLAGLIGMIPNCASSVLITELYLLGGLNLGSAVAGLSVNAGIAFAVLFQQNKPQKQNFAILIGLYLFSCTVGTLIMLIF